MADIIKINRNSGYTTISTHHLWNKNLSMKAKGLMSMMLSTPPSWESSVRGYAQLSTDGRTSVTTALKELEAAGYVQRKQLHNENGQFVGCEYTVNEIPVFRTENSASTIGRKPDNGTPSDSTIGRKSDNGFSVAGNQAQVNNLNKLITNKPKGVDLFDLFWTAYPRKVKKPQARKAWDKLHVTEESFQTIMKGLERWKVHWAKKNNQFASYPASWLNGECWNDDPEPAPVAPPPQAMPPREDEWRLL